MPKPKPSQLSQSPLIPGHLGQTLVSDMTFYCRPDIIGSLESRTSHKSSKYTGVGTGGGGARGHVPPPPLFRVGGKDMFVPPPLSDPEFRDVPPPILSRSYAVEIGYAKITQIDAFNYVISLSLQKGDTSCSD